MPHCRLHTHIFHCSPLTVRYFRFPILSVRCLPLQEFCHRLFYEYQRQSFRFRQFDLIFQVTLNVMFLYSSLPVQNNCLNLTRFLPLHCFPDCQLPVRRYPLLQPFPPLARRRFVRRYPLMFPPLPYRKKHTVPHRVSYRFQRSFRRPVPLLYLDTTNSSIRQLL